MCESMCVHTCSHMQESEEDVAVSSVSLFLFPLRQSLTELGAHHFLVLRVPGVLASCPASSFVPAENPNSVPRTQHALFLNLLPCPIIISFDDEFQVHCNCPSG